MRAVTFFVTFFVLSICLIGESETLPIQHVFTRNQIEREVEFQRLPIVGNSSSGNTSTVLFTNMGGSCLSTACKMAGSFGCDSQDEITDLSKACRKNFGDECLRQVCTDLGYFACDENSEIKKVLLSCQQSGS